MDNIEKDFYRFKFKIFKSEYDISVNFKKEIIYRLLIYKNNKPFYTMYKRYY